MRTVARFLVVVLFVAAVEPRRALAAAALQMSLLNVQSTNPQQAQQPPRKALTARGRRIADRLKAAFRQGPDAFIAAVMKLKGALENRPRSDAKAVTAETSAALESDLRSEAAGTGLDVDRVISAAKSEVPNHINHCPTMLGYIPPINGPSGGSNDPWHPGGRNPGNGNGGPGNGGGTGQGDGSDPDNRPGYKDGNPIDRFTPSVECIVVCLIVVIGIWVVASNPATAPVVIPVMRRAALGFGCGSFVATASATR